MSYVNLIEATKGYITKEKTLLILRQQNQEWEMPIELHLGHSEAFA